MHRRRVLVALTVLALADGVRRELRRYGSVRQVAAVEDAVHATLGELSRAWLQDEHLRLRNIVQLTAPAAFSGGSVEAAADTLFDNLVVDPERRSRKTRTAPDRSGLRC